LPSPRLVNADAIAAEDLALAGRLALSSRHPLAAVIVEASLAHAPLDGVEEPGRGVRAVHDGREIKLGSPAFCDGVEEATLVASLHPEASLIAFRKGDRCVIFAISQALRPDAVDVVAKLRRLGLHVLILSGDRQTPVAQVAQQLGIADYAFGLTPADKIRRIETLKAQGHRVLMVGDGLNDAPALAVAHASLSPMTAVHVTQGAADAVFLGRKLAPVLAAVIVSRHALHLMVQNLCLAVVYNLIAVPLAIAGYATPLVAALAMSGSSLIVTLNALRAGRARENVP
jgi:P-type Cu2+ transporter